MTRSPGQLPSAVDRGHSHTVDQIVDPTTNEAPLDVGGDDGAVEQVVYSRKTTLTNAQIKALPTTPIELVPAPGAGKTIVMIGALLRVKTASNGYANVSEGAYLAITFAGEGLGVAQGLCANYPVENDLYLTDFLSAFSNMTVMLAPYTTSGDAPIPTTMDISDIENKALEVRIDNQGDGALMDGHANNDGSVTVIYTIVDL